MLEELKKVPQPTMKLTREEIDELVQAVEDRILSEKLLDRLMNKCDKHIKDWEYHMRNQDKHVEDYYVALGIMKVRVDEEWGRVYEFSKGLKEYFKVRYNIGT